MENGVVQWQNRGLALMACIERYGKGGQIALAFTTGGIQKNGAVASSWAHDHHNLMVMGSNVPDMIAAANHLLAIQGGYCVCVDEKITACASLQVGGIVSDQPLAELARADRGGARGNGGSAGVCPSQRSDVVCDAVLAGIAGGQADG